MKSPFLILALCLAATMSLADDDSTPAPASASTVTPNAVTSNAQAAPKSSDQPAPTTGSAAETTNFVTAAKWQIAGYNNNEIVYTILVTSHDTRIIRCMTELKGSYFESGKKISISDRQSSTVFPDQQVQVGNWMGLDEKSGVTYSVKCHPI